jgi:hypothetical protein
MILSEIRDFARRFANTNATKYTDEKLDASINAFLDEISADIITAMDGWDSFGEISTTDLIEGQQEYVTPENAIWVKRLEISYDGTQWNNVSFMDVNERSGTNDAVSIARDFTPQTPFADLHEESLFLYPIPTQAVAGGLKLWYIKLPTPLTDALDKPGFIRIFHKMLSYGASKDFLEQYINEPGNPERLRQCEKNIAMAIEKMKKIYNKHNQDRSYVVDGSYIDWEYGND